MRCPACGRDNLPGASRCAGCAKPLPRPGAPTGAPPVERDATRPAPAPPPPSRPAAARSRALEEAATSIPRRPGVTGITGVPGAAAPGGAQGLVPGTYLGARYLVEAVLGEGGMGMVYKARDLELNRTVALKVIRPELASHPEILERFKREILLASQVTHKNVVRIHDLGEAGDLRFISMSFIEGESLRALLDREGPLPPERGVPLVRDIALALQAAHEAGIVHRDLKPHNVLLDRDGTPYVGDFGISRSMDSQGTMTETGAILGTVDYMSPEQAKGDVPDQRSDIYSLGMMMFEMFTGALPFRAANPLSVMVKRVHEDAPSATQVRPGLPPWLSAIIMRALQRDPSARYQTLAELVRDLDRQRATRARRRLLGRRALLAAGAIAAVLLLAVAAGRFLRSRPQAAPVVKSSLALLPFRNETADPRYDWVRSGLTSVLRTGLLQARSLRLAGDDRVTDILSLLKPAEGEEARPATMERLGRLAGVDNVFAGRLLKVPSGLRLEGRLLRVVGGGADAGAAERPPLVVDGRDESALLGMLDDLTRKVRDDLGVRSGFSERALGAAQLTSRSVEALSLYGEGLGLDRSGKELEAVAKFEAAVGKDPGFAMAQAALAEGYDALGRGDDAKKAAGRAVDGLRDASPWEAAHVRAVRARIGGDLDQAETELRAIVDAAPNDTPSILDLAGVQEDRGELPDALRSLTRAVALDPKHPDAHYLLGRVLVKSGRATDALAEFNAALALHGETGNDEGRATVLNGLGNTYQRLNQFDEAERYFRQALDIRRRIHDQRGVAVCLNNLALVHRNQARFEDSLRDARESLAVSTAMNDKPRAAESWLFLGDTYGDTGRPEQALQAYQEGLKLMREVGDDARLARSLRSLGYVNAILGKYVEAFFFMKEALEKSRATGDKRALAQALNDIGIVEQFQGRYEEALRYYAEAMGLTRDTADREAEAAVRTNMAQIQADQGEYAAAFKTFADAEAAVREIRSDSSLANCLSFLGEARRRAGDLAGAGTALDEAIRLSRGIKADATLGESLTYEGLRLLDAGKGPEAAAVLKEAARVLDRVRDFRLILMTRLASARAARAAGALDAALAEVRRAGLDPLLAPGLLAGARLSLAGGRAAEAQAQAAEGERAATRLGQRDLLFQARHLAAEAMRRAGRGADAQAQYLKALEPLEEMRSGLAGDALTIFLARPETAAFARDADEALRGAPAAERDRLARLTRP